MHQGGATAFGEGGEDIIKWQDLSQCVEAILQSGSHGKQLDMGLARISSYLLTDY